jgi:hypothetical protein
MATKIGLPAFCAAAKASGVKASVSVANAGAAKTAVAATAVNSAERRESMKFSWLLMSWFYNALWLPEVTNCPGRINSRCVNQGGSGKAVRGCRRNRNRNHMEHLKPSLLAGILPSRVASGATARPGLVRRRGGVATRF